MITVHHLELSRSHRIIWALEEMGIDYKLKVYKRNRAKLAPKEFRELHPIGKSPLLSDGDQMLAESAVILEHLVDNYGSDQFRPALNSEDYQRYRYWMHAAEGSIMPLLVMKLIFHKTTQAPVPIFLRPLTKIIAKQVNGGYLTPSLKSHQDHIEKELSQNQWFGGGSLSAADFQMSYVVEALNLQGNLNRTPHTKAYFERIRSRPAYQRALKKGGDPVAL